MAEWLLVISRDAELARAISHALCRFGSGHQLWAVENVGRARSQLSGKSNLPSSIVIDELFLRGEPMAAVADEFAWFAPVIVIARPARQTQLARLVAAGKADFVPRDDHYIPLTVALVERTIRWEKEVEEQIRRAEPVPAFDPGPEGSSVESLRLVGNVLDCLETVFSERSRLSAPTARRLDRLADLAFELKRSLRELVGHSENEIEPIPYR
jgi:hypothetical protein